MPDSGKGCTGLRSPEQRAEFVCGAEQGLRIDDMAIVAKTNREKKLFRIRGIGSVVDANTILLYTKNAACATSLVALLNDAKHDIVVTRT